MPSALQHFVSDVTTVMTCRSVKIRVTEMVILNSPATPARRVPVETASLALKSLVFEHLP
jgi:hypothetical protein